ncbi:hypothetical protein DY000_02027307 [Brassica cretica]|uniref:Secreted protein n=1 Tax=Brassica cretica TaxID=69181 RepID=A0ABQ7ELJ8_BRACR|nr:hypothetical protein DY000_02027307 [Brassica cretica]
MMMMVMVMVMVMSQQDLILSDFVLAGILSEFQSVIRFFTKRAIPGVALQPDRQNLQETQLSNFLRQVQLLPRRHTHPTARRTNPKIYQPRRASASKREMSGEPPSPRQARQHHNLHSDGATN